MQGHPWHVWFGNHPHWHSFFVSLAGWITGGAAVWSVRIVGRIALGKEAMGFGDVTLLAMIGSFVGWQPVLAIFFVAPVFAVVLGIAQWVARGQNLVPYGPFLCLATLLVLFTWKPLWVDFYAVRLRMLGTLFGQWLVLFPVGLIVLLGVMLVVVRLASGLTRRRGPGAEGDSACAPRAVAPLDSFDLYLRRRMLQAQPKQAPPVNHAGRQQENHRRRR